MAVNICFQDKTIYQLREETEKLSASLESPKYDELLRFVNEWLNPLGKQLRALTDFKRINKKLLLKNTEHNDKILQQYSKKLIELFNVKIKEQDATEKISDEYIIMLVSKLLYSYGYIFVNVNDYMTIKKRSY